MLAELLPVSATITAMLLYCCSVVSFALLLKPIYSRIVSTRKKETNIPISGLNRVPIKPLIGFDYKNEAQIEYRPFKTKSHVSMGIMKSSRDHWIRMDRDYLNRIEMRKALLRDHDETIIGVNSIVAPAIEELYEEIMLDYLPQRYPSMFQRRKGGKIENLVTGATYPDSLAGAGDPATMLRLMGQHVEEDFYIMCPDEAEEYRLQGYVACFPGGFLALARVGMSMRDIHKPVPGFEERIGKSVDRYFRRMEPGNFIGRMNWSIQCDGPDLFRVDGNNFYPDTGAEKPAEQDIDLDATYLRVEHQTLTRLPKSRAIIFCVRTYINALNDLREEGSGPELADAIESMPEKLGVYKMRPAWGKKVLPWLREKC